MMNVNFYPGPSQLYPQIGDYLQDAYRSGILSMNHRSAAFMDMLSATVAAMHDKLAIPVDYEIYFTSSATECWEIVSQSLVEKSSLHAYNGAFGQKWLEYSQRLHPAIGHSFGLNDAPALAESGHFTQAELLCLTHNETSNGTVLPDTVLKKIRKDFAGLIAVDATSSMAGVALPWAWGDVWLASVQKCFGLPPGLGVLVVSPRAIERAKTLGERNHYNSLLFIRDNFAKSQTPYTPNTLAIYLLGRVMAQVLPIEIVDDVIDLRAERIYHKLRDLSYEPLVENPETRSATVVVIQGSESTLRELKAAALAAGMQLGNGYGDWKSTTLRIANFPAIPDADYERLFAFLLSR